MAMDAAGISVQVLSIPGPGAELVAGDAGIAIAGNTTTGWVNWSPPGRGASAQW